MAEVTPEIVNVAQVDREVEAYVHSLKPAGNTMHAVDARLAAEMGTTPPRWVGPTTPAKAPSRHLLVALMSCSSSLHGCVTPLLGVQEAAKYLGWRTIMYNGAGLASTENANILNAISRKVNAIMFTSINPATIQQGLVAAKRAGIPVLAASSGSDTPNPVVAKPAGEVWPLLDVSQSFVQTGVGQADWMIKDSGGHANVLVLTDREYTSGISQAGIVAEFQYRCPGCKLSTFNFSGTTVGTPLATQVVGYLRSHPQINYVDLPYDPAAAAVVPAMATAGMTKVKVCSLLGDEQNLNFIRQGQIQACDGAYDNYYAGWAMVDQLIRYLDHKPFATPHGENLPQTLLTKSNLVPAGTDYRAPYKAAYEAGFLKLWGVKK